MQSRGGIWVYCGFIGNPLISYNINEGDLIGIEFQLNQRAVLQIYVILDQISASYNRFVFINNEVNLTIIIQ